MSGTLTPAIDGPPSKCESQRSLEMYRLPAGADAVSNVRQNLRKFAAYIAFRAQHSKHRGGISAGELVNLTQRRKSEAQSSRRPAAKPKGIWSLESLGFAYAHRAGAGRTFAVPGLDPAVLPILHVGAGLSLVDRLGFEPGAIRDAIDGLARSDYRQFPLETLGAMLAHHGDAPGFIRRLLGLRRQEAPRDMEAYFSRFDGETRRVMSHGYGRIVYFSRWTLGATVQSVLGRSYLDHTAAMQGIAFGYTMTNFMDLLPVLRTTQNLADGAAGRPFLTGVIYALVSVEWTLPGWLEEFTESRAAGLSRFGRSVLDSARENVAAFRRQGRVACFKLAIPPAEI